MDINLSNLSEDLRNLAVRYQKRKSPDALSKNTKDVVEEHRNYWYTFDAINAETEDTLINGYRINQYLIADVHAGLQLPESVRIVNSQKYVDTLVRPDLTKVVVGKDESAPKLLKPSDFNALSDLYAHAMNCGMKEFNKVDIKVSTAFEEKYFIIEDVGGINYNDEDMPFVVKSGVGFFVTDKVLVSGLSFKEEVIKHVKHKISDNA